GRHRLSVWLQLKRFDGRLESLRRAREKRNAKRLLDLIDMTPERRLRQLQSSRRARKVAFAEHRQKRAAQLPNQRCRGHSFSDSDYSWVSNSFLSSRVIRWALS